ncbi:MAG: hypothetical protein K6E37_06930 [Bacteroidales bacterium]|nr:hypothetical protein [Bacteroidales bacterium]
MKIKFTVAAALILCACTPVKTDLEKYALNCKAKEIVMQSDTLELPYKVVFNSLGQADTVFTYNFDGSFRYREIYTYNDKHQVIEIAGINADEEDEARYEYEYSGRFIKECRLYGMNNQEVSRWEQDNDGRHIVKTGYYSEGELAYTLLKHYSGKSYTEETFNPDGSPMGTADVDFLTEDKFTRIKSDAMDVEIQYNDKALPVMSRGTFLNSKCEMLWSADLDDNPIRYYTYDYDSRGNWIARYEKVHPDSTASVVLRRTIIY